MKFFYDYFDETDIAGVFSPTHFVILAFYFAFAALALYLSRKFDEAKVKKATLVGAIVTCSMEVVKIVLRLIKGQSGDDWIPLYVSSLFMYASWMSLAKNETIRTTGIAFLSFGSTTAGIVYAIYPSTALIRFPVWHPGAIHGILYHWIILYVGALTLWKRFKPKAIHSVHFLLFMTAFTIPAFICNTVWGYNLMFIGTPAFLPPLQFLYDIHPYFYGAVVFLAQAVGLYWAWFGIYKLAGWVRKKLALRRAAVPQTADGEQADGEFAAFRSAPAEEFAASDDPHTQSSDPS